jgi:hypothetical protein
MEAVYATRERVMRAADVRASAYFSAEIDERLASASRSVDRLCHRGDGIRPGFAPWAGTVTYDWPANNNADSYRFWLNQNALYSLSAVSSGGETITSSALLRPETGPPYSSIIVNRAGGASLTFDTGIGEASLALTGVWCGCPIDEVSRSTWLLSGNITSSVEAITINAPLGVGNIIRIDSERMIVADRAWGSSGQTGSLASSNAAQTLTVADGTAFFIGEELILDAERVLIHAITGNNLLVQRAVAGSPLAAHTTATIYYSRTFTMQRGQLGTTGASHLTGAPIYVYRPPALISQLTVAYAIDQGAQENSAYARTVSMGEDVKEMVGRGLKSLEERVYSMYGRKNRMRSV